MRYFILLVITIPTQHAWADQIPQIVLPEKEFIVFNIEITQPNANDVFLKGENVEFIGKIKPDMLASYEDNIQWSFSSGSGIPLTFTGKKFQTIITSEGQIGVKAEVTINERTARKEITVESVLPEVVSISWKNDQDIADNNYQDITDPVWMKTLKGGVIKNEPGAYTNGVGAQAELEIKGAKPLTHLTSVQVKGIGSKESFYGTGAYFQNWTWAAGELQLLSSPLYSSVNFYDALDVDWGYRIEMPSGEWGDWVQMNQSVQVLYTVLATPTAPEGKPRKDILDYACRWAANETTEDGVSASILNNGFSNHYTWDYDCHRLSSDFIRLIASVGIGGSQHNWASKGTLSSGDPGWMCQQKTKSFTPVGGASGVREWSWHQWAQSAGAQRDPSAAASKSGMWGGYEDDLFTNYYQSASATPFAAIWVANQNGQNSGCEKYPENATYNPNPPIYTWRGPDR